MRAEDVALDETQNTERMTTTRVSVQDLPDMEDRYCKAWQPEEPSVTPARKRKGHVGLELSEGRADDLGG